MFLKKDLSMRITESRLRRVIKDVVSEISRPVSRKRQIEHPASNPFSDGVGEYDDGFGSKKEISYEVKGRDGSCVLVFKAVEENRGSQEFIHGIIRRVMFQKFGQTKSAMSTRSSDYLIKGKSFDEVGKMAADCTELACAEITGILKFSGFNN
tara:strand:+ start:667 stop:1125 length:459 start_codon:yes stop_codon:yes gene_type:complete